MKITKLNLKRETLRELNAPELKHVAGGKAAPPTYRTCLISECTCTTFFTCPPDTTRPDMPC